MPARRSVRECYAASVQEKDAIKALRDLRLVYGGWFGRVVDARGQEMTGWPDCALILPHRDGTRRGFGIEIKIDDDVLRPEQREVLTLLDGSQWRGIVVRYGRPRPGEIDQDEALDMIAEVMRDN